LKWILARPLAARAPRCRRKCRLLSQENAGGCPAGAFQSLGGLSERTGAHWGPSELGRRRRLGLGEAQRGKALGGSQSRSRRATVYGRQSAARLLKRESPIGPFRPQRAGISMQASDFGRHFGPERAALPVGRNNRPATIGEKLQFSALSSSSSRRLMVSGQKWRPRRVGLALLGGRTLLLASSWRLGVSASWRLGARLGSLGELARRRPT